MNRNSLKMSALGGVLGALSFIFLAGNTAPTCVAVDEAPESQELCLAASDCEGLSHAECEGSWGCVASACVWTCDETPEPVYCASDAECGEEQYCTITDGDCYPATDQCYAADGEAKRMADSAGAPCMGGCLGICKDKEVVTDLCMSDAECGENQYCTINEGACLPGPGCGMDASGDMACPAVCYGECVDEVEWPPVSECQVDSDCPQNFVCQMVDCVTPPCTEDGACMEMCAPVNKCINVENPEDMCRTNADCAEGERCTTMDGQCLTDTTCGATDPSSGDYAEAAPCLPECFGYCIPDDQPPPSECSVDADCSEGFYCSVECWYPGYAGGAARDASGAEADMACNMIGTCLPSEVLPECVADEDCPAGYMCEVSSMCEECFDAAGVPCDGAAEMCQIIGYCVPKVVGCTSDEQCGVGYVCQIETICADGTEPADPSADPMPYVGCETVGSCVPSQMECNSNLDCPMGYACESITNCLPCAYEGTPDDSGAFMPCAEECTTQSVCVPQTQPSECYDDTQCGTGYYCQTQEVCPPCVYEDPGCKMACQLVGTCMPKQSECQADSDCGAGYRCDFYELCGSCPYGDCLIACPVVGICVATAPTCYSDYDCDPGYTCQLDSSCYEAYGCDPNDPSMPCSSPCLLQGVCVLTGCEGIVCAVGEVLDLTTCTCQPSGGCVVSGCSGEICAAESMASECVWMDWYECLQSPYTTCGPFGPNGECQWQQTEAFTNCLAHFGK